MLHQKFQLNAQNIQHYLQFIQKLQSNPQTI